MCSEILVMVYFFITRMLYLFLILNFYHYITEVFCLRASICPESLFMGLYPSRYQIQQAFRKRSLKNHGVAKALIFAAAAISEVEADFYKVPNKLVAAAAMSGAGQSVYSIRFKADKYTCKSGVIDPTSCSKNDKGYECCAIVADTSPAIMPRKLLEYECLDFSAKVDGDTNEFALNSNFGQMPSFEENNYKKIPFRHNQQPQRNITPVKVDRNIKDKSDNQILVEQKEKSTNSQNNESPEKMVVKFITLPEYDSENVDNEEGGEEEGGSDEY